MKLAVRKFWYLLVGAAGMLTINAASGQETLDGTWKLISVKTTNATTGDTVDAFGPNPQGYITYGKDGRMIVIMTRSDRPKPESIATITAEERNRLFSSMLAYAGTYRFDGKSIQHHIEISWNEVWSGTMQVRDIISEGDRLVYTTRSEPSAVDGRVGVTTLLWEKVK